MYALTSEIEFFIAGTMVEFTKEASALSAYILTSYKSTRAQRDHSQRYFHFVFMDMAQ